VVYFRYRRFTRGAAGAGAQLTADGASNTNARETPTPNAEDFGLSSDEQGSGLVDAAAALGLDSGDDGTGSGPNC